MNVIAAPRTRMIAWTLVVLLLLSTLLSSVVLGIQPTSIADVWHAITAYNPTDVLHIVIVQMRLPRTLLGLLVGASLAVAGVLMQSMTQNPLASPSLMGLNAGGTLLLVLGILFIPSMTLAGAIGLSLLGAAAGAGLVYMLVLLSPRGMLPARMTLAGMVVSILLGALTQGLIQQHELAMDILYWTVGGLSNMRWAQLWPVLPPMGLAMLGALLMAPKWTVLALGHETSIGLGINLRWVYLAGMCIVLVLAGCSVAVAGPVMLVGLMAPHISKLLVGTDCRKVVPVAAMVGAILVVTADTLCRVLTQDRLPLGAFTAVIGGIVFIVLARRGQQLGRILA